MGVHGLWKLIEPSGQMVPLETLAGKVLAVDVSIWLHQAVKGMHDAHGAPLALAHLIVLFHRVCKLLFYKIKPVFVFDGGVPTLKHQTMAARRQRSNVAKSEVMKVREKLIKNLLKHEAVRHMMSDVAASAALGLNSFTLPGPSVEEDLYKLPPIAVDYVDSECSDPQSSSEEESEKHAEDIHSIDVTSKEFLSLPAEIRHDILTELIETRKQSSWKYLDNMPKKSDSFSDFQMSRLLKRRAVQTSLEEAGKEMGGRALSLKELESLLGDQGVLDTKADLPSKRIAQDSVTRFMLVHRENSETHSEQTEGKHFDIMNHLEEVEWSSESDTDIILQKTPERKKRPNNTKQPAEVTDCEVQEKQKESCSVSKEAKIVITEEVAGILSILDDKDTRENKKLKADLEINEPKNNENASTKTNSPNLKENVQHSSTESPDNIKVGVSNKISPILVPDFESKHEETNESKIEESNEPEIEDTKETQETESKIEPEITPLAGSTEVEKTEDFSSDSEKDFIPITDVNSEMVSDYNERKNVKEPIESPAHKSDSITVVIKPSELDQKDDLFADVFKPVSDEFKTKENENTFDLGFEEQISNGDINSLRKNLEEEHSNLLREKGKQERLTLNMSDQVYNDAQELLQLFGIPFVVAPMEAEAQCATLNVLGLTEGTITDDSDIWLFGGQVVYKNFFNQQKHVLEYRSENIQKYFKLTREEMIKIALLVGSDYTVGLSGIGPVTALEIIAAFQGPNQGLLESLQKFRDWFTGAASGGPVRAVLRKKIRNLVLTPGFPNRAVVEAYLHPQVDDSKEPFSWAKPNLNLIREYVRAKLGWSSEKCNELLLPVMKKLEENTSQSTIDSHFKIIQKSVVAECLLSKRVESAVKRLGSSSLESGEPPDDDPKPRKKRKQITSKDESSSKPDENNEELLKLTSKFRTNRMGSSESFTSLHNEDSRIKLLNEKLHQNVRVPQKELAQKLLEEKKKEAIKIFRTYKKSKKQITKVYAKEEVKLSESSSEDD